MCKVSLGAALHRSGNLKSTAKKHTQENATLRALPPQIFFIKFQITNKYSQNTKQACNANASALGGNFHCKITRWKSQLVLGVKPPYLRAELPQNKCWLTCRGDIFGLPIVMITH